MTDSSSLSTRIEAADASQQRELDAEIWKWWKPKRYAFFEQALAETIEKAKADGLYEARGGYSTFFSYVAGMHIPRFTSSVDEALTLVPAGWSHGYRWNNKHQSVRAWCEFIPEPPFAPEELLTVESRKCTSIALAIAAASIRAQGEQHA